MELSVGAGSRSLGMRILQVLTYVDMKTGVDEHEEDGRLNIITLRKCLLDDTRVLFEDS